MPFARPNATISSGGWTAVGAATLHAATNEITPDDATSYAGATASLTARLGLADLANPGVTTGHYLRVRWRPTWPFGSAPKLEVQLWQAGVQIATTGQISGTATNSWQTDAYNLTGTEAGNLAVTSGLYQNLEVRFLSTIGGPQSVAVTWFAFEVPGATEIALAETGSGAEAISVFATVALIETGSGVEGLAGGGDTQKILDAEVAFGSEGAPIVEALGGAFGRTRVLNITGEGDFGYDPIIGAAILGECRGFYNNILQVFDLEASLMVPWRPEARLLWFGGLSQCSAYIEWTARVEYQGTDCLDKEFRWIVTIFLTLWRRPGASTTFSAQYHSDWAPVYQACDVQGVYEEDTYNLFLHHAVGHYTIAETARLTENERISGAPGFSNKYETKRVESFHQAGSCNYYFLLTRLRHHYRDPIIEGGPPPVFGHSYVACQEETDLTFSLAGANDYSEPFGTAVVVDNNHYWKQILLYNVGLHLSCGGSINYNDPNLACLYSPGPVASHNKASLSGSWDSVVLNWTGTEADWETGPFAGRAPSASVMCDPSWALSLLAHCYDYATGAEVPTTINLENIVGLFDGGPYWRLKLASMTSGSSPLRYPSSGYGHHAQAFVWDGVHGAPPPQIKVYCPLYFPVPGDVPGGVSLSESHFSSMAFGLDATDADAKGRYLVSEHWALERHFDHLFTYPARKLWLHLDDPWEEGRLTFASTHRFKLFDDAAQWSVFNNAAFLAANPAYTASGVTITEVGGALKVSVTSPKVLIRFSGKLKAFAYRWHRLRVKTSGAEMRLRFGVGSLVYFGAPWFPQYAWELATAGAGVFEDLEYDFAYPQYSTAGAGGTASYAANSNVVHPATWFPPEIGGFTGLSDGADVWVEFLDAGDYYLDYDEGFYKTGGTHKPLLAFFPLDGFGDLLVTENCEYAMAKSEAWWQIRVMVNGVHGFSIADGLEGLVGRWQFLYNRLHTFDNDTGITVVTSPDIRMGDANLHNSEFRESKAGLPFGRLLSPGSPTSFFAQRRASGAFGYYGMGDPVSGHYSNVNAFRGDWVWNGEVLGNAPGATLELRDNDTGALVASASADDDGLWRAKAKYGVVFPFSNPRTLYGHPVITDYTDIGIAQFSGAFTPVYTTQGKKENSYWVKPTGLAGVTLDGAGYLLRAGVGTPRFDGVILDRAQILLDFRAAGNANPWNLATRHGHYLRADVVQNAGNLLGVRVQRAEYVQPPFVSALTPASLAGDIEPRLAQDDTGRLFLVFAQDAGGGAYDVYRTFTDADGNDVAAPVRISIGAKHPDVSYDPINHVMLFAHRVQSDGHVSVERVFPGQQQGVSGEVFSLRDSGGALLLLADTTFRLAAGLEGWWWLSCVISGETSASLWYSTSDARTWTRLATGLAGAANPTLGIGAFTGTMLWAARVGNDLKGRIKMPGDALPEAEFAFTGGGGDPLQVEADTFHVVQAVPLMGAARWVLTARFLGESGAGERWSASDGQSWTRV